VSDIDQLISAQLDGELDEDGHRRLEEWLAADPEHRRRFLRQSIEHRALRERLLAQRATAPRQARARQRQPIAFRLATAAAVAAALAIAAIGGWRTWSRGEAPSAPPAPSPSAPTFIASVTAASDATVEGTAVGAGAAIGLGDRLTTGSEGRAVVRMPDGTLLTLAAGTTITLTGQGTLVQLGDGHLDAEVAPHPADRPLCFQTAEAWVVVVGTRLEIARAQSETVVGVTHGAVGVARDATGLGRVEVRAGQRVLATSTLPLTVKSAAEALGTTYAVGAGQSYATLDAVPDLGPGDVVEIHPGTYRTARSWKVAGTALRPVMIRGVGGEPPLIDGEGLDVSGVGAVPRALLQISGEHAVIAGLSFANARNHANAAAIRLLEAKSITVQDCRIARCDDGISCGDECDDLAIVDCDIGFCGTPEKDGYCHDVYIGGGFALVRGCDIHDALNGQALKSSCRRLEIVGNRIHGAEDGEISFIGAPGTAASDADVTMIGNLVASKPGRHGNSRRFIETDDEKGGGGGRGGTLHLIGNTFVAADPKVVFVATLGGMRVIAEGNIFSGSDQVALLGPGGITGRRNWLPPTATVPAGLGDRVPGDEPGFADADAGDYRLRSGSPCLGAGVEARYRDAAGRDRVAPTVGPGSPLGVAARQGPPAVGAFGPAP
jgi:ferric-dicitrate binding protein FerR (iron transport regulator)